MPSRKTIIAGVLTVLTVLSIGTISVAAVGTAMADRQNNDQMRFNATARCQDGTWSWSKRPDAPETCLNHGGVAR
jgi:hypothetical protein